MDSMMVYVPVEVTMYVLHFSHGIELTGAYFDTKRPKEITEWLYEDTARHFELTDEEERDMENLVTRKLEFEVEVWYKEETMIAKTATCQTECPNFVKAWVEQEAIRQFNKEHEGCEKSST